MRPRLPRLASALALALAAACASPGATGAEPTADADDVRSTASPPFRVAPERRLVLLAPREIAGRLGAVQLEVRLRNDGPQPVTVATDPWLADLAVTGARGPIRCAPAAPRMDPQPSASIEPGASLPLRVDLSSRCYFTAAGDYDVEVSFEVPGAPPARARVRVAIAPRTWVNPGPR
jgi:hypothetical protein